MSKESFQKYSQAGVHETPAIFLRTKISNHVDSGQ